MATKRAKLTVTIKVTINCMRSGRPGNEAIQYISTALVPLPDQASSAVQVHVHVLE